MNNVVQKFIDKNERIIKIEADQAKFNNTNYYTNFNNNVRIQYLNNIITSDTLNYNFETNEILLVIIYFIKVFMVQLWQIIFLLIYFPKILRYS